MKRSIMTEKIARRGYHIYREYGVDPLERHYVDEVMTRSAVTIDADLSVEVVRARYFGATQAHRAYPVVRDGVLIGMLDRATLDGSPAAHDGDGQADDARAAKDGQADDARAAKMRAADVQMIDMRVADMRVADVLPRRARSSRSPTKRAASSRRGSPCTSSNACRSSPIRTRCASSASCRAAIS